MAILATLTVTIPGRGPMRPGLGPSGFFTEATVVHSVKEDEGFYTLGVRFMGATFTMYSPEAV